MLRGAGMKLRHRVLVKSKHGHFELERPGAVCSVCGEKLPADYYIVLAAWHTGSGEEISPRERLCQKCWDSVERYVERQDAQYRMLR